MDSVIFVSIITIAVVCVILGYMGWYAYKHIKADIAAEKNQKSAAGS